MGYLVKIESNEGVDSGNYFRLEVCLSTPLPAKRHEALMVTIEQLGDIVKPHLQEAAEKLGTMVGATVVDALMNDQASVHGLLDQAKEDAVTGTGATYGMAPADPEPSFPVFLRRKIKQ